MYQKGHLFLKAVLILATPHLELAVGAQTGHQPESRLSPGGYPWEECRPARGAPQPRGSRDTHPETLKSDSLPNPRHTPLPNLTTLSLLPSPVFHYFSPLLHHTS